MTDIKNKPGPKPYVPTPEVLALIENHRQMADVLDEKQARRSVALIVKQGGPRSKNYIAKQLHVCQKTINRGLEELEQEDQFPDRVRKPGGGRKPLDDSRLSDAIQQIVEPDTYGCPQSGRIWTTLSLAKIAVALAVLTGLTVCANTVRKILKSMGYTKKKNRKMQQKGPSHPDRDEQFTLIELLKNLFIQRGNPIISIDCKKKEKVGLFKNDGEIYTPKGKPILVEDHDFAMDVAVPYGIYDLQRNYGYMVVGTSHDTAEFAANCIDQCIQDYLLEYYEGFDQLLILCDGGGSNGSRSRLWKKKIKELADKYGIEITVAHYPPGCSKYNPIEHRLFSAISKNWQGQPLDTLEKIVNLIHSTTTKTGLTVDCKLDLREYETGIKVSGKELSWIERTHFGPCPNWNYTIPAAQIT